MRALWLGLLVFAGCGIFAAPGAPCRKHEECAGLKDGYCARSEICTKECSDTSPCPDNSRCFATSKRSVCLPTCMETADCQKTFTCIDGLCQVTSHLAPPQ